VRNITDFGLFVGLQSEIDGLVHHSDISWTESGEEAIKAFNKGDTVKAKVLLIDVEKERISLGIKQLQEDKSSHVVEPYSKGQVVTCTVIAVEKDGIEVSIGDEGKITAYIKRAELSRDRQEQRPERFAVRDRVDAKVIGVEKKLGKLNVSIKAYETDEHKRAIDEYGSTDSGASLGAILGAALEEAGSAGASAYETKKSKKATASKSKKKGDSASDDDEE
jgi:small subunit ribosomal protein S1